MPSWPPEADDQFKTCYVRVDSSCNEGADATHESARQQHLAPERLPQDFLSESLKLVHPADSPYILPDGLADLVGRWRHDSVCMVVHRI